MASIASANGNSAELKDISELKSWLFGRVCDDNDIVIDELQSEFGEILEKEDENAANPIQGSEEYKRNIQALNTSIASLERTGCKVSNDKQKVSDGIRPCWYGGAVDDLGRPNGQGMLKYDNNEMFVGAFDHGLLNRSGKLSAADSRTFSGSWRNGLMDGEMRVEDSFGGWTEGYWKFGVPHGFQREFGPKDFNGRRLIRFAGRFFRGVRRGFCWKGLLGGGFLCGFIDDSEGDFTGDDLAFIYPDFKTVIRGEFSSERLVEGRLCELTGCKFIHGIGVPTFSDLSGQVFTFEDATKLSIGKNPLLRDPWEDTLVYVKQSNLPQGGEGLFAKRDIKAKELICYYNGIRIRTSSLASKYADHSDYRIRLNADIDLDIPHDRIQLSQYCATLGHKVNHSNLPNADWAHVEHPRFGLIRGLSSQSPIKKDEEILINYHINLGDSPIWYRKVWLSHQRNFKKKSDESVQRFLDRYYDDTGKRVILDLNDEDFVIPDPKGVSNLQELPDDDDVEEDETSDLALARKLLRMNKNIDDTEEPRITEIIET